MALVAWHLPFAVCGQFADAGEVARLFERNRDEGAQHGGAGARSSAPALDERSGDPPECSRRLVSSRRGRLVKIGTRSVLYGVHAPLIHGLFVALAWWRAFRSFPWDVRLWCAFFVHDLGYWGCGDMDGEEGKAHPRVGGALMRRLFGREWGEFTAFHSRSFAAEHGWPVSCLAVADKLVWSLEPWWLYLPRAWASGELGEYMAEGVASGFIEPGTSAREWYRRLGERGKAEAGRLRGVAFYSMHWRVEEVGDER